MDAQKRATFPWVTVVLIAINVVVFLVSDLILFRRQDEIEFYMALNPFLVLKEGEYWRIITSMFYHFGIDHLVFNMLMLGALGNLVEPFMGRVLFLGLYLFSGISGSLVSLFYNSVLRPEREAIVFCAGASGAIYGLIGAFVACILAMRKVKKEKGPLHLGVAVFVLLFGSIFETGVGHDAHLGGFFAGALFSGVYFMVLLQKKKKLDERRNNGGSV